MHLLLPPFLTLLTLLLLLAHLTSSTPPPYRSIQFQANPTCVSISPTGLISAYYNHTQQVLSYTPNGTVASSLYIPFPVSALTTDSAGNLYVGVANSSSALIRKLSPTGTVLTTWDGLDNYTIASLALDGTGALWATNSWANLHRFNASGGVPTFSSNSGSYTRFPSAITIDQRRADALWWVSGYENQLFKVNTTSLSRQSWYMYTQPITGPTGIAIDSSGLLYLADPNYSAPQVVRVNVTTTTATVLPFRNFTRPAFPQALAINADDTLWVADTSSSVLTRYSTAAASLATIVSPYPNLNGPDGLATDPAGVVHVLDGLNARVLAMQSSGAVLGSVTLPSTGYRGLAIDATNNSLWVGVYSQNYFKGAVYSSTGSSLPAPGAFFGSYTVLPTGVVWQASPAPNVVVLIPPYAYRFWMNGSQASFVYPDSNSSLGPQAITVNPQGQLLLLYPDLNIVHALQNNQSSFTVAPSYITLSLTGPSIAGSQSMACDALGQLYIASPATNSVLKYSSAGLYLESWSTVTPPSLSAWSMLVDINGDVWTADGPNNRLVVWQQSQQPQLVQFFYTSAPQAYPRVCVSAVLSCLLIPGSSGALSCVSLLSGNHTYYPAAQSPSIVTPLLLTSPTSCRGASGHGLPLDPSGFVLGWGVSCSYVFSSSGTAAVAVDAVMGVANASYAAVGSPSPGVCPAPVLPVTAPSLVNVSFVYVVSSGPPQPPTTVCGSGVLQCTAYGSGVLQCATVLSGEEFTYSGSYFPNLRSAALSTQAQCQQLGDGVLPLTWLGLSFYGTNSPINGNSCSSLYLSTAGTPQLNTAAGTTTFIYGNATGLSPQQVCQTYIPQLSQSSSSSTAPARSSSALSPSSSSPAPASSSSTAYASSSSTRPTNSSSGGVFPSSATAVPSSSSTRLTNSSSGGVFPSSAPAVLSSSASESSSLPIPPPPPPPDGVVFAATLLSASAVSFVANQSASLDLSFQAPQNVLILLLNASGLVSANDGFDPSSLPPVDLSDWQSTLDAYCQLADAQGLAVLYSTDSLEDLSPDQSVGDLSMDLPPMDDVGYHRLLVVTGNGTMALSDWIFVVPFTCDTWLREDGTCAGYCPTGGFCTGDGRVWPEPQYWSVDEHSAPGACPLNLVCPGALEAAPTADSPSPVLLPDGSRDTQRCELGYTGPYCAQCDGAYYHSGTACRFCGNPPRSRLVGAVIVAVVIATIVGLMLALSSPLMLTTQIGAILTVQQLVSLGQMAFAALPDNTAWLQAIWQWVGLINLDVTMFQPGCLIPDLSFLDVFGWTLAIVGLAAVLFTGAAALRATVLLTLLRRGHLFGIGKVPSGVPAAVQAPSESSTTASASQRGKWMAADRDSIRARMEWLVRFDPKLRADASVAYHLGLSGVASWRQLFYARWQHAMMVWGALIYLRLTTEALQLLHCTTLAVPDPLNGQSMSETVLVADYTTVCWHGSHIGGVVGAIFILVVLSAGYPLLLAVYLLRLHSPSYLQDRLAALQAYTAKFRRNRPPGNADVAAAPITLPSSPTPQSESLRQYLWRVYSAPSSNSSRATSEPGTPGVPSTPITPRWPGSPAERSGLDDVDVEMSTVSNQSTATSSSDASTTKPTKKDTPDGATQDDEVSLQLVQQAILARMSSNQLSDRDAAHLDVLYLKSSGRMLMAERDAYYAYVLKGYRTDDRRRVYLFPVVGFVLSFLFCCSVVFPGTIALTLLLSGLTFVAQGALVALLQPFVDATGNLKSAVSAAVKLLQCLVALGLIPAVNTAVIHGDPSAVHSIPQQMNLAQMTFNLFADNTKFIVTLTMLLMTPALLALIGWRCRVYFQRKQEETLWNRFAGQTDFSATAASRRHPMQDPYTPDDTDTEPLPQDASSPPAQPAPVNTPILAHLPPLQPVHAQYAGANAAPEDPYAYAHAGAMATRQPAVDPYAESPSYEEAKQALPSQQAGGEVHHYYYTPATLPAAPTAPPRPSHHEAAVALPVAPPLPQRPTSRYY